MNIIQILRNPYILISLCISTIVISRIVFKIDYMNCFKIINNHISIFTNEKSGKLLLVPFSTYIILPFFLALAINRLKTIDIDMMNIITIILSILTSMLFTLLVMVIDMKGKMETRSLNDGNQMNIIKSLIKETYYSIMFEILIAISLLVLSFVYLFTQIANCIASIVIYYLIFLLIFNLFIVLKRIFNIIDKDLCS